MRSIQYSASRLPTIFAWTLSITLVATAIRNYVSVGYDPETGTYSDGFGRELHEGLGSVLGRDPSPGVLWEIADIGAAILLFALCRSLFVLARRLRRAAAEMYEQPGLEEFLDRAGDRPYRGLVQHLVRKLNAEELAQAAAHLLEGLPDSMRARGEEFIDAINFLLDDSLWRMTCRDAFRKIIEAADEFFRCGLTYTEALKPPNQEHAFGIFHIATLNFAYNATLSAEVRRQIGIRKGFFRTIFDWQTRRWKKALSRPPKTFASPVVGWLLLIASAVLVVVHTPWWCLALVPLILWKAWRWTMYKSRPWRRVHFHVMRLYARAAGIERRRSETEGEEFDTERALTTLLATVRPDWNASKIRDFLARELSRCSSFADRSLIRRHIKRVNQVADDAQVDELLDKCAAVFHIGNRGIVVRLAIAGLVEEEYGEGARGEYLFEVLSGKAF